MATSLLLLTVISSLFLLVPGVIVSLSAGAKGFWVLGLSPALSVGVISFSAVAAAKIGVQWNLIFVVIATVLFAAVSLLSRFALPRLFSKINSGVEPQNSGLGSRKKYNLATALGLSIAALAMVKNSIILFHKSDVFSQTFDNIFHMNLIRWMLESGVGSSLDVGVMGVKQFYPAAWHDLVLLLLQTFGSDNIPLANNAVTIATLVVVWPVSMMLAARVIFPAKPLVPVLTGILSVAFTTFPLLPIGYGVLFPNFLAVSFLPALVGLTVNLFRLNRGDSLAFAPTLWFGFIGGIGLSLAHPNAVVGLICFFAAGLALTILIGKLGKNFKYGGPSAKSWRLVLLIFALCVADVLAYRVLSATNGSMWPVTREYSHALGEFLLVMPRGEASNYLAGILTCVGIYFVLRCKKYLWLLLVHAGFGVTWAIMVAGKPCFFRNVVSGPWYGDGVRVGCLMVITAIPIAVFGSCMLLKAILDFANKYGSVNNPSVLTALVTVPYLVVILIVTQLFGMPGMLQYVQNNYSLNSTSRLVDDSEYKLIKKVPEIVPAGEKVVVNSWNGSALVYALEGVETTEKHATGAYTDEQRLINEHLDDAEVMPQVCDVLAKEDAKWVLDFSNEPLINDPGLVYPGYDDLDTNPGFEEVAREGDAALYKITACGK